VEWFLGPELHDLREREFVEALSKSAEAGAFPGVVPTNTVSGSLSESSGKGLTIGLAVPKLTCQRRWLVVSYEPGQDHETPVLQSSWSTDVQLDTQPGAYEGPSGDSDLWVTGIDAGPSLCADWVSAWLGRQLRRPVTRREWDQPETGPGASWLRRPGPSAAVEWYLGDPDEFHADRGTFGRWRLTRQPPSREVRERP
jgi:hypothetical protein